LLQNQEFIVQKMICGIKRGDYHYRQSRLKFTKIYCVDIMFTGEVIVQKTTRNLILKEGCSQIRGMAP